MHNMHNIGQQYVKDEHRTRNAAMFGTFDHENLKNSNNMFTAWQFQWKFTAAGSHETKWWEIKQKRENRVKNFHPPLEYLHFRFTVKDVSEQFTKTQLHFVQHYGHEYFTCSVGETCWIVICIGQNYNESLLLPSGPIRKLKKYINYLCKPPEHLVKSTVRGGSRWSEFNFYINLKIMQKCIIALCTEW